MKKKLLHKIKTTRQLIPHGGDDRVYTPPALANKIVEYFNPQIKGIVLEPCVGKGAFVRAINKFKHPIRKCEIDKGSDFFDFTEKVSWIITNPPWSLARRFAQHSYEISDNIVFLITVNHFMGLKARRLDMERAGFGIKEIVYVDTPPKPWPQSGFQLAAIHIKRGYKGKITQIKI